MIGGIGMGPSAPPPQQIYQQPSNQFGGGYPQQPNYPPNYYGNYPQPSRPVPQPVSYPSYQGIRGPQPPPPGSISSAGAAYQPVSYPQNYSQPSYPGPQCAPYSISPATGYPSAPQPGYIHSAQPSYAQQALRNQQSPYPSVSRYGVYDLSGSMISEAASRYREGVDVSSMGSTNVVTMVPNVNPSVPLSNVKSPQTMGLHNVTSPQTMGLNVTTPPPQKAVPISDITSPPQNTLTKKPKKEKNEFYDLVWEDKLIKRMDANEVIDHLFVVTESNYFGKNPAYLAISNRRLILMTEDLSGGVYWPLETTQFRRTEVGKMLMKWSRFYYQSTLPNSTERYVQFEEKKDASVVEALFKANVAYGEYRTVYINNRNNVLAVFNEECDTVIRFSKALSQCSNNISALFIWLLSVDYVLPLVRKQLKAAANEWTKSNIGNTSIDDFQMLDVIQPGSDEEQYLLEVSKQIANFFSNHTIMKQYCGAIPLLDAYYYYGKATANDLKSPEEFLKACNLLTESLSSVNHVYVSVIKGKQMLCTESVSFEKAESIIMNAIDAGNGSVARSALIREMGMPMGICEDIISRVERSKKIVRDNASGDVYYYKNVFGMVKTKTIRSYSIC